MHLGALSSLAEVGIGLNMAFSVVRTFREWLGSHVKKKVEASSLRIQAALAEFDSSAGPPTTKLIGRAKEIEQRFTQFTEAFQHVCVCAAIGSATLLIGVLAYIALHGEDGCDNWVLYAMLALVAGPVGVGWLALVAAYGVASAQLSLIESRYRNAMQTLKELTSEEVRATEPDEQVAISSSPPATSGQHVVAEAVDLHRAKPKQ